MKIPLKVKVDSFYRILLPLMDKFPPIRGLREKEIKVLSEIMYQNYLNRNIEDFNKRQIILFSTESRRVMRERLGMQEGSFNDYLSKLRRNGIVTKDNKLKKFFDILPGDKYEFIVSFQVQE